MTALHPTDVERTVTGEDQTASDEKAHAASPDEEVVRAMRAQPTARTPAVGGMGRGSPTAR